MSVAACGGGDSGSSVYKEPKGPAVAQLTFSAKNFAYTPDTASAPAGIIGMTLKSTAGGHDLVIEDVPGFKLVTPASGDTDSGKVELKKGKYTFYCSLPGHRAAGMVGTLTVS
ncbi:MAG: plastocyanin/azurin family copper-binding protein [Acidimicrobiia bacterium]